MGSVNATLKDNQIRASVSGQPNQEVVVVGHSTSGTVNVPKRYTSISLLRTDFGNGEGVEAAVHMLKKCGVVRFCRATATAASAPTLALTGTSPLITASGNPSDNYEILITCVVGGTLGTAKLSFSFDDGRTTEYGQVTTAASITQFAAETGLTFACPAGTYVVGDTWKVTCGRPVISGANYSAAITAALAMPGQFRSILCVGVASSIANQVTAATTVNTTVEGYFTAGTKAKRVFFECTTDSDATVTAAIASTVLPRTILCLGHEYVQSYITGRVMKRSQAWSIVSRCARIPNSEKCGRVRTGPIDDPIVSLTRDDAVTPGAKDMRCAALRTRDINGVSAVYGGPIHTLALGNSDFSLYVRAATADKACELYFEYAAQWLEEKLLLTSESSPGAGDGGRLTDEQAAEISKDITGRLRAEMRPLDGEGNPTPQADVTEISCVVSTSNNVASDSTILGTISMKPYGYSDSFSFEVGFTLSGV